MYKNGPLNLTINLADHADIIAGQAGQARLHVKTLFCSLPGSYTGNNSTTVATMHAAPLRTCTVFNYVVTHQIANVLLHILLHVLMYCTSLLQ